MATSIRPVPHPDDADHVLVARAQAGDARAFELLAQRHATPLRRLLYRLMRDCEAAKEAVQEALLRAWVAIDGFESRARFSTWFTRIGLNAAYTAMGRRRELPYDPQDGFGERPDPAGEPEALLESRELLHAVERALGELREEHRTAVVLSDFRGYSNAEGAELVGIGERAYKSRLHRGRRALRARLDEAGERGRADDRDAAAV